MVKLDNYEIRVKAVINRYKDLLFSNSNIVGFGRGIKKINNELAKEPSLTIYVEKKVSLYNLNPYERIPKYINGAITDVVEVGCNRYLSSGVTVSSGRKISNANNTQGGTVTYAVSERGNQKNIYILSCNHVLARRKGEYKLRGVIGDKVRQMFTVTLASEIGTLVDIAPLHVVVDGKDKKTSDIDAALALIGKNTKEIQKIVSPGLSDGTLIIGVTKVKARDVVYKIGAVSGRSEGSVDSTDGFFTAKIDMYDKSDSEIIYENVTVTNQVSRGGDSGSMGVVKSDKGDYGFGILVASGDKHTIFTSLQTSLDFFKVELLKPL